MMHTRPSTNKYMVIAFAVLALSQMNFSPHRHRNTCYKHVTNSGHCCCCVVPAAGCYCCNWILRVVVYLKRQAVPNQSNPEPGYNGADRPSHAMIHSNPDAAWEEVQPVTATHYIMTPSTAYGVDRSSRTLIQSNPDAAWEEVRPVTATHTS